MQDSSSSTDPHAPMLSRETIVCLLASAVALLSFFLPWVSDPQATLSAFEMASIGFGFLYTLPVLALLAAFISTRRPPWRPLSTLMTGVAGLLIIWTLISLILNNDSFAIAYRRIIDGPDVIVYTTAEGRIHLGTFSAIGLGFYVAVLGYVGILIAPLTRALHLRPKAVIQGGPPPEHAESLADLRSRWTLAKEYRTALVCLLMGFILVFTYNWCGMSPKTLWENRRNAKEYLFGRALNEGDKSYIEDQARRAPEIEAQGLARAFQDNKYRGMPFTEQPTIMEKMKESDVLAEKYLAEMSEEKKAELTRRARAAALQEKRGGYFPPETAWPRVKGYLVALLETIAIAIWGTLLAVLCAIPASLFAAENTLALFISGDGKLAKSMRAVAIFISRRFLDACRGFNEFVMALIFVAVIGLGPFAGILALWIHTFGVLGKVFSEQIEAIENGQIEALSSTGATVNQIIAFSVLPQVMPGVVSYSLLRFESNVRSAAILGFVGAGGIGFLIFDKLNGYLFREVCTMMIIIIVAVGIIDNLCKRLRKRFI
jgi:phosphonate transport system permease protein